MNEPILRLAALYDESCQRTFAQDMGAHLTTGYVFSTPEEILLARPVASKADPRIINNPYYQFRREDTDCWYIYGYADTGKNSWQGLVKKVLRWMPYELPLVAWERKRDARLRFYEIKRLAKLCQTTS
jgi:hypothetical protein